MSRQNDNVLVKQSGNVRRQTSAELSKDQRAPTNEDAVDAEVGGSQGGVQQKTTRDSDERCIQLLSIRSKPDILLCPDILYREELEGINRSALEMHHGIRGESNSDAALHSALILFLQALETREGYFPASR